MTDIEWTHRPGTQGERWNPVPSWPEYEVTRDGQVRNAHTQRLIMPRASDRGGHLFFTPVRGRKCYIHRAVLETYTGACPTGMETRHLDGDKLNNRIENLAWGTRLENAADRQRHGHQARGERSGTAKLTEDQVREIRTRIGTMSLRALAIEYGVSHTAIRRAANGTKWRHVA